VNSIRRNSSKGTQIRRCRNGPRYETGKLKTTSSEALISEQIPRFRIQTLGTAVHDFGIASTAPDPRASLWRMSDVPIIAIADTDLVRRALAFLVSAGGRSGSKANLTVPVVFALMSLRLSCGDKSNCKTGTTRLRK
jgi:hypothetical protein